jgi:hypothetical protein
LKATDFHDYYPFFLAVFLALLIATAISLIAQSLRDVLPALVAAALALFLIPQQLPLTRAYLEGAFEPAAAMQAVIPDHSCVVLDQVVMAVASDRFDPPRSCPVVVDAYATWIHLSPGHAPTYAAAPTPGMTSRWATWLAGADFVVQIAPGSSFIPWSPTLRSWFDGQFTLVHSQPGVTIYKHTGSVPPPYGSAPLQPG